MLSDTFIQSVRNIIKQMYLQNITNLKRSVFKFLDTYKQIIGHPNLINIINSFIQSRVIDINILNKYNYCEEIVDEYDSPYFIKIVFDGNNESVVLYILNDVYLKILFEYILTNTQSNETATNKTVVDDILNENENLETDFDTLLRQMLIDGYKQVKSIGFIDNNMTTIENNTYINESETYDEPYDFSNNEDVFEYLERINNRDNNKKY